MVLGVKPLPVKLEGLGLLRRARLSRDCDEQRHGRAQDDSEERLSLPQATGARSWGEAGQQE